MAIIPLSTNLGCSDETDRRSVIHNEASESQSPRDDNGNQKVDSKPNGAQAIDQLVKPSNPIDLVSLHGEVNTSTGIIEVEGVFGTFLANFVQAEIRRLEGTVAPSENCSEGEIVYTRKSPNSFSRSDDSVIFGRSYSYRLCLKMNDGKFVSTDKMIVENLEIESMQASFLATTGNADYEVNLSLNTQNFNSGTYVARVARKAGTPEGLACSDTSEDLILVNHFIKNPSSWSFVDKTNLRGTRFHYEICLYNLNGIEVFSATSNADSGGSPARTGDDESEEDTTPPPSLVSLTITPQLEGLQLNFNFPELSDYRKIDVRRIEGTNAPENCSDGEVVSVISDFTAAQFLDDRVLPNSVSSYRLCIYDAAGNVTSSESEIVENVESNALVIDFLALPGTADGQINISSTIQNYKRRNFRLKIYRSKGSAPPSSCASNSDIAQISESPILNSTNWQYVDYVTPGRSYSYKFCVEDQSGSSIYTAQVANVTAPGSVPDFECDQGSVQSDCFLNHAEIVQSGSRLVIAGNLTLGPEGRITAGPPSESACFQTTGSWNGDIAQTRHALWGPALDASHSVSGVSGEARWRFSDLKQGSYDVYATWLESSTRSTGANYYIRMDGENVVHKQISQRNEPGTENRWGVPWEKIGTVNVIGDSFVVILKDDSNGSVSASTIRLRSGDQEFYCKNNFASTIEIESGYISFDIGGNLILQESAIIKANIPQLSATDLTLASGSSITASALGWLGGNQTTGRGPGPGQTCGSYCGPGGGAHGGDGGRGSHGLGGTAYASESSIRFGSGGSGRANGVVGHKGGGLLKIELSGNATIDGIIAANGNGGGYSNGGGAGGSVIFKSGDLRGTGVISAFGGNGSTDSSSTGKRAGGGGGGVITISCTNDLSTIVTDIHGGGTLSGGIPGSNGLLFDSCDASL